MFLCNLALLDKVSLATIGFFTSCQQSSLTLRTSFKTGAFFFGCDWFIDLASTRVFYHLEPVIKSEIFTFESVLWFCFKDHNLDRSSIQIGFSKTFYFQPQISFSASYDIWVQVSSALIYIYFWAQISSYFHGIFSLNTSIPYFISLSAFIIFFIPDRFNDRSFHHWHPQYNFIHCFHFSIHFSWCLHYRPYFICCLHPDFISLIAYITFFISFEASITYFIPNVAEFTAFLVSFHLKLETQILWHLKLPLQIILECAWLILFHIMHQLFKSYFIYI